LKKESRDALFKFVGFKTEVARKKVTQNIIRNALIENYVAKDIEGPLDIAAQVAFIIFSYVDLMTDVAAILSMKAEGLNSFVF
jgi:hypothetical protein